MPIDARRSKRLYAEEPEYIPTLCQRCTSGRKAELDWPGAGWVCWSCYEEMRPQTAHDAELERRLDSNGNWYRGDEPRSAYRKRMLAEWRSMPGPRRMP